MLAVGTQPGAFGPATKLRLSLGVGRRVPDGGRVLGPGDIPVVPVCPAGAHQMKADVMGVWHNHV